MSRGRAVKCLHCDKIIGQRGRCDSHIYKHHLSLEQAPFYCTACLFRCKTQKQLDTHVQNYEPHQHRLKNSFLDDNEEGFLRQSSKPYFVQEGVDFLVLSKDASDEYWESRRTTSVAGDEISLNPDSVVEEWLREQEQSNTIIDKLLTEEERKKQEISEIKQRLEQMETERKQLEEQRKGEEQRHEEMKRKEEEDNRKLEEEKRERMRKEREAEEKNKRREERLRLERERSERQKEEEKKSEERRKRKEREDRQLEDERKERQRERERKTEEMRKRSEREQKQIDDDRQERLRKEKLERRKRKEKEERQLQRDNRQKFEERRKYDEKENRQLGEELGKDQDDKIKRVENEKKRKLDDSGESERRVRERSEQSFGGSLLEIMDKRMEESNQILAKAMSGIASAITAHALATENLIKQLQMERKHQAPPRATNWGQYRNKNYFRRK